MTEEECNLIYAELVKANPSIWDDTMTAAKIAVTKWRKHIRELALVEPQSNRQFIGIFQDLAKEYANQGDVGVGLMGAMLTHFLVSEIESDEMHRFIRESKNIEMVLNDTRETYRILQGRARRYVERQKTEPDAFQEMLDNLLVGACHHPEHFAALLAVALIDSVTQEGFSE